MSGPPDEKWIHGDSGLPYWRPSTVGEDRWLVIVGAPDPVEAAQPAPDTPGRPEPPPVAAVVATPDPEPIPVTRAQRIRTYIEQVRSGDRSAVHLLRAAMRGHDDDAA